MLKETFDHSTFQQEQKYHNIIILYVGFHIRQRTLSSSRLASVSEQVKHMNA